MIRVYNLGDFHYKETLAIPIHEMIHRVGIVLKCPPVLPTASVSHE